MIMSTPAELRESAKAHDDEAARSFDQCDTDGFLSQWAHGVTAREDRMKADLIEAGGYWEFQALFTLDGKPIANAREVETRYGWAWVINNPGGSTTWFNPSKAKSEETRKTNDAKKGYRIGRVRAKGYVRLSGSSGTGLSGALNVSPYMSPVYENGHMIIESIVDDGR
jgi:hypothetical protein